MDTLRYVLALLVWSTVPPAVLYWYLIHPFAGYWRSVGPVRTWLVVVPLCLLALGVMLRFRGPVAASDLGQNFALFYSGLVIWTGSILLDRKIQRQADPRTLTGLAELRGESDELMTEGVYRRLRHPRYAAVLLGTLGFSLMAHHGASYAIALFFIPLLVGLIRLEEEELDTRFGDTWRDYRRRVPMLIPRRAGREEG